MHKTDSIYRERFIATLEHKGVDRCPIDLGGTPQSTMDEWQSVDLLARYLGLEETRLPIMTSSIAVFSSIGMSTSGE